MAKARKDVKKEYVEREPMLQPITETIETNYMPYVVSVMVSRAIPEIDGFKPAHRKILYTMYKMGLMNGPRRKSANIVGETMKLHPHGDMSIYETMVRLSRGNETLLHPFIDSKGSFGKQYSTGMVFAAPRYTEARLEPFCAEIFSGIERDAVDMVDNYDGTMKEPKLLPTTFPNILVSSNLGIAVGLASSICSFNLGEICDATIAILKNPKTNTEKLLELVKAPDFPGGGYVVYDKEQMAKIYETGRGTIKLRAKYEYNKAENRIDFLEIPYSTTIEAIKKEIIDNRDEKFKEVTAFFDEIGKDGFKASVDLKKDADPEKVMQKLYKFTPLEDSFSCNFNVIVDNVPKQLGIKAIIEEWIRFRIKCVRREFSFDLNKKNEKLHLLLGLGKILLDIDKAIRIVRDTEKDQDVVPNLMVGFDIDRDQAEYIADIKLRHLNREYILNRLNDIEALQKEIATIKEILADELKVKAYIVKQLLDVKKKYGKPRKTQIIYASDIVKLTKDDMIEDYDVNLFFTKDGYLKKITNQSLRGNAEQKLKEGDSLIYSGEVRNKDELMFFTNQAQVYFARVSDFDLTKASELGEYVGKRLNFDDGERPVLMIVNPAFTDEQKIIFVFENGKAVRIPMSVYATQGARKKLKKAYSTASPLAGAIYEKSDKHILLINSEDKAILIRPSLISEKTTRTAAGSSVFAMNLNKNQKITEVLENYEERYPEANQRYRKIKVPATGVLLSDKDITTKQIKIK
ncbi:MAG: topoisomerase IV [Clostridia bacterium]|nr:topoisomerase IV [Clostridia bacterium]